MICVIFMAFSWGWNNNQLIFMNSFLFSHNDKTGVKLSFVCGVLWIWTISLQIIRLPLKLGLNSLVHLPALFHEYEQFLFTNPKNSCWNGSSFRTSVQIELWHDVFCILMGVGRITNAFSLLTCQTRTLGCMVSLAPSAYFFHAILLDWKDSMMRFYGSWSWNYIVASLEHGKLQWCLDVFSWQLIMKGHCWNILDQPCNICF